ncbi:MAG: site-specific DNA-methyltransferase, partial [Chloroflexi bacterium]|nr:site-specific DNA-methyltransferase [Chloroflexota bacterium]
MDMVIYEIASRRFSAMTTKVKSEYGTFRDSMRAPIHRWFTYPAGYSHKFVEAKIGEYGLTDGSTIADPFLGTGTTSVTAKMLGINSVGIEAHSFVHWVAKTKMFLHYDIAELIDGIDEVAAQSQVVSDELGWQDMWPPLVYKCFTDDNLRQLAGLRYAIDNFGGEPHVRDFLKLALTSTLRIVTTAGSGWPYIAPSKYQSKKTSRQALKEFKVRCQLMVADIQQVQALGLPYSSHDVLLGDARKMDSYVPEETIDLIVTSPPYLNNYDYADRTMLETYFWGIYESWADITREVRDHLVIAATTQVRMSSMN